MCTSRIFAFLVWISHRKGRQTHRTQGPAGCVCRGWPGGLAGGWAAGQQMLLLLILGRGQYDSDSWLSIHIINHSTATSAGTGTSATILILASSNYSPMDYFLA